MKNVVGMIIYFLMFVLIAAAFIYFMILLIRNFPDLMLYIGFIIITLIICSDNKFRNKK